MYLKNFVHKKTYNRMEESLFLKLVKSIVDRIDTKSNKVELPDVIILVKSAVGLEYDFVETGLINKIEHAIMWSMMGLDDKTKNKIQW